MQGTCCSSEKNPADQGSPPAHPSACTSSCTSFCLKGSEHLSFTKKNGPDPLCCIPFKSGYQKKTENLFVLYHSKNFNSYLSCALLSLFWCDPRIFPVTAVCGNKKGLCPFRCYLFTGDWWQSSIPDGAGIVVDHSGTRKHDIGLLSQSRGKNNCSWSLGKKMNTWRNGKVWNEMMSWDGEIWQETSQHFWAA